MQRSWLVFPLVAALFFLWFGGKAGLELRTYSRLKAHTPVLSCLWTIEEKNVSKVFLRAEYTYMVQGRKHAGATSFAKPVFNNRPSAEGECQNWMTYNWSAWYDPAAPDFSSLQRLFPLKTIIYALVSLGLLIYFLLLPVFYPDTFSKAILKKP